jgi:hypothetical protein
MTSEIKTPLTYGDALALVDGTGIHTESDRASLAHALMAVDQASREQAWADRGGPELLAALKEWFDPDNPMAGIFGSGDDTKAAVERARAAIVKAEGR